MTRLTLPMSLEKLVKTSLPSRPNEPAKRLRVQLVKVGQLYVVAHLAISGLAVDLEPCARCRARQPAAHQHLLAQLVHVVLVGAAEHQAAPRCAPG